MTADLGSFTLMEIYVNVAQFVMNSTSSLTVGGKALNAPGMAMVGWPRVHHQSVEQLLLFGTNFQT